VVCRASPSRQRSLLSASEAQGVVRISCWSHNEIGPVEDKLFGDKCPATTERSRETSYQKWNSQFTIFVIDITLPVQSFSVHHIHTACQSPVINFPKMFRRSFLVMTRDYASKNTFALVHRVRFARPTDRIC